MKAYLINLNRCPDRLNKMKITLDEMGLEFTRVPAFDGMGYARTINNWTHSLTPSEYGCLISHIECLKLIVANGDDYSIVLEDDVLFSKDARVYLTDTKWIPKEADIIKFETCGMRVEVQNILPIKNTDISAGRLRSDHWGAAGFIITKKAAQKLLVMLDGYEKPIDVALFSPNGGFLNNFIVYQIIPALCRQAGLDSTINEDRAIWENEYPIEAAARKIKTPFLNILVREVIRPYTRYKRNKKTICISLKD